VKLVFINDRDAEISAYHYCIHLDFHEQRRGPKGMLLVDPPMKIVGKTQLKLDPQLEQVNFLPQTLH